MLAEFTGVLVVLVVGMVIAGAMLTFTIPLAVGLIYEWMKGGLEW